MLSTVMTENGAVRGLPGNNTRIAVFKGIPFAAPPVGKNRWCAPKPCENWEGVRDAYKFGPISMQDTPGIGDDIYIREWHVDSNIPMDEDCLYLNVWTPALKDTDNLPVLVWFFGGAFQWGYPPEMEFNGENIAKRGVIVVSVNYRLGAFGFLAHPEITSENPDAPTNFGMLDQQAGIKWVVKNIKAFGGNPENITIMGQSAGGGSVLNHLTSKSSIGLYQKAVILSGAIRFPYNEDLVIVPKNIKEAEAAGQKFFELLGVKSLEEARQIDAKTLRDKASEFRNANNFFFTPCVDNVFIDDDPFTLFLEGKHANVPIISGNTGDEFKNSIFAENDEEFEKKAREIFGEEADRFLSFPEAHKKVGNAYATADNIECAVKSLFAKNTANSYYYLFNPDIPGWDNPGTFHSVDLWFFFDNLHECWRPFKGRHYDLARMMCNYLTNFVKTGDPNGNDNDGVPMPKWNPYRTGAKYGMEFLGNGPVPTIRDSEFNNFITEWLTKSNLPGKKQALNPYLPSWEYIPDGEPYVFGDRVYIYGSHDYYDGTVFCPGDYTCWSANINDLGNWRCEGVIYERTADPLNKDGKMCLYAPDVTIGPDNRYYLYYALDKVPIVSVAVCDTPAGKYEFYGYVHYEDGTILGEKEGDEPQFDPGVITENGITYLFTGFCGQGDKSRSGAMLTLLKEDMITIKKAPRIIAPGCCYSANTPYEGHAFFEAPSIRKFNDRYYFIYSSEVMHELCYATADSLDGEFKFGGVIVSNCDLGINTYKPADKFTMYGANNHGSLIQIKDKYYIFYHRHTNNSWYNRQGCAEEVKFNADGSINQVEITSCGLNNWPLKDTEEYPSYIACNIFKDDDSSNPYVGGHHVPFIKQEGRDGDKNDGYIACITDKTTIGFKYFDFKGVKSIEIGACGYGNGEFLVKTSIDGPSIASVKVEFSNVWEFYRVECPIPDGISALYLTYTGGGDTCLKSIRFIHQ